ncbi:type II toxin-antitoxin system Phd/YefM family antitoxin [Nakamurella sp. PAMC28650]|jgi:prevent-host-death family protein|uniref:type II toxin-antitoxin system Phd/YefM family antitoxin n=1 Tax=Nakamurella sp. PAMC28650 TaxID=2762325 RepID=UPI00164E076D|nr:type II toxin-antitoxin system prevent-host-death family antitoxin [Nakamurella sp. PAMC28650]QNK80065.1 type II toxin-antitoxin system prevent-host-death family antitoxin [Nakamurella sp. PAMC28650]
MKVATSSGSAPVGVRDLKNHLSAYLDLVKSGQEILVTEHGRPIARLSPVTADIDRMVALVEAGIVQPPLSAQRGLPTERIKLVGTSSLDDDVAAQRG